MPHEPTAKLRVLFVDHANFRGGAQQYGLELLHTLDRARIEPIYVAASGPLIEEARQLGVEAIPIELPRIRGLANLVSAPLKLAAGIHTLIGLIRRTGAHIVHANTMRASIFAAPAARRAGARFVWHVHDLHRERPFVWLMSRAADAILCNSQAVAATIPDFARLKLTVVYNGVDLQQFDCHDDGLAFRTEFPVSPAQPLVGNIGWLAPWKGQRAFVNVAAHLAAQCPDAHFVVVGAVTDERYRNYAAEMQAHSQAVLGDRLRWAGARSPIAPVLCGLDLLLHCADQEPFGRVLIEAMAARVPVIAFAGGGPDEIVVDGETGFLIPNRDENKMAEAALTLLADPQRRRAMGAAARARVEQLFNSAVNVHLVEQVYESLA